MFQIKIASKPLVLIAADDNGVAFDSGRPLGVGEQVALDRFVGGGLHLYYAPVDTVLSTVCTLLSGEPMPSPHAGDIMSEPLL